LTRQSKNRLNQFTLSAEFDDALGGHPLRLRAKRNERWTGELDARRWRIGGRRDPIVPH